jgi:hypothetical protein
MGRAARLVLVVPALAALAALALWAVKLGSAETLAWNAAAEINTWTATRVQPGFETWLWVRDDLLRAERRSPRDPSVHELLGVIHARRAGRTEFVDMAVERFARAIELRPTSPYTWANMAVARYQLGKTEAPFEAILVRSALLGPSEPEVQRAVADLGLAMWDEVTPATRALVERHIAAGMRRNPLEMLQISYRRGRLEAACRHLVPGQLPMQEPFWLQQCSGRKP